MTILNVFLYENAYQIYHVFLKAFLNKNENFGVAD